jgi:hypothetical protein
MRRLIVALVLAVASAAAGHADRPHADAQRGVWTIEARSPARYAIEHLPEGGARRAGHDVPGWPSSADDYRCLPASVGNLGQELWALPLDALPDVCVFDCPGVPTEPPARTTSPTAAATETAAPAEPTPTSAPSKGDDSSESETASRHTRRSPARVSSAAEAPRCTDAAAPPRSRL